MSYNGPAGKPASAGSLGRRLTLLFGLHLLALTGAPPPINYVGAAIWVFGAVFLFAKPNDRDTEIPQLELFAAINAGLLGIYWMLGQITDGSALAATFGVAPDMQDMAGVQLVANFRFVVIGIAFLGAVAYVGLAFKRLFWDRRSALFDERARADAIVTQVRGGGISRQPDTSAVPRSAQTGQRR